ncbi:MAG: cobyrinate a,c-diamide synthase [Gammaproteobacteria bacterium]|nr:MAG: cobyrinate a,c-diamide synthase [Gammaproteobacteria bacterium]
MANFLVSAAHKSSGKTTVTVGLCAALSKRGNEVQPFKKGPDYIDPLWLSRASGRPCYNLDFNTMQNSEIKSLWHRHAKNGNVAIVEGNKGLFDSIDLEGKQSNAALARLLGLPVVLVVDVSGITRGVAPLLIGYQQFEQDLNIAGVILNKIASTRHEGKVIAAVEEYTDIPVLGAVYRNADILISERHLGLVPSNEIQEADNKIQSIADVVGEQVDLDKIINVSGTQTILSAPDSPVPSSQEDSLRIGIARDAAFGFYYQDDLDAFESAGAELIPINMINDHVLPDVDALFIGGGFPETHMSELASNRSMLEQVRNAVVNGMPVYAECGGLMYLCRQLSWKGETVQMANAVPADVVMHERPQGRGYVRLRETGNGLWPMLNNSNDGDTSAPIEISAHEFHHSTLENIDESVEYAYEVLRGAGINGKYDGMIYHNTMANYTHLRDVEANHWVRRFIEFIKSIR